MTNNELWRRYLEAGAAVGQVTATRAEEIARGLLAENEDERNRARRDLEGLVRFGTVVGEHLVDFARAEVARQWKHRGADSLDRLFDRVADVLGGSEAPARPEGESPPGAPDPIDGVVVRESASVATSAPSGSEAVAAPKTEKSKGTAPKGKKQHKKKKHKKEKEPSAVPEGDARATVLRLTRPPSSAHGT